MTGSKLIACRFLRARDAMLKSFPFMFLREFVVFFWLDNINRTFFGPLRAYSGIDTKIDQKKYLFPRLLWTDFRFPADINYSVASLKALESLSDEWNCVLLALFSFYAYEPARNIAEYYHVYMYLIVRKYEIELLLSAINTRERQCSHRTFHFPFTVHSTRKIHPIS